MLFGIPAGHRRRADLAVGLVPLPGHAARPHQRRCASASPRWSRRVVTASLWAGARTALVAAARPTGFALPATAVTELFALLVGLGALGYLLAVTVHYVLQASEESAAAARRALEAAGGAARSRAARAAGAGRSALSVQQPELDLRPDRAGSGQGAADVPAAGGLPARQPDARRRDAHPARRAKSRWPSSICGSSRCASAARLAVQARVAADAAGVPRAAADPAAARRERRAPRHRHAARGRRDRDRGQRARATRAVVVVSQPARPGRGAARHRLRPRDRPPPAWPPRSATARRSRSNRRRRPYRVSVTMPVEEAAA